MIHQTFQICKSIKIVLKTKLKVERKEKEIAIPHHPRKIIKITCLKHLQLMTKLLRHCPQKG